MKMILIFLLAIISTITLSGMLILKQSRFGKAPKKERLERILKSPNYRNGEFKNLEETSVISDGKSRFGVMMDFMFKKKIRVRPDKDIPVVMTDIKALDPNEDVLIWFGHSSYFIRIQGKTFLVDPVFSKYAAPFSFINKAFKGSTVYSADNLPTIDYLVITHDHWDHLDYHTVLDLKPKVKHVVCGLGVGQDFESWGFDTSKITELDWYDSLNIDNNWKLTATPARHYSGRSFKSNQTLWASYVLQTPSLCVFVGGDSGYGSHFKAIGEKFGPFDLAILEQGQYDNNWNQIHLLPNELLKTVSDLMAKRVLPVHNSRFALANHPWYEPLDKIAEDMKVSKVPILTPQIGEVVYLNDSTQKFSKWWRVIEQN